MPLNPFAPEWTPVAAAAAAAGAAGAAPETYEVRALVEQAFGRFYVDVAKMPVQDVITAVKRHPGVLEFIPEEYRIPEICWAAMETASQEVIDHYKTQRDSPLRFVPMQYRTEKMCMAAAAWGIFAIKYFPETFNSVRILDILGHSD
jgi:hypothetical protein